MLIIAGQTILPDLAPRIEAKIGRFHIYGHGLSCHTLFNLIRSPGWALMVGEENEYDWSRMAHLVSSGRVSTGPRRTQKIDAYGLFTARRMKERMGSIIDNRFKRAIEVEKESQSIESSVIGLILPGLTLKDGTVKPAIHITREYLIQQAANQESYYKTYK